MRIICFLHLNINSFNLTNSYNSIIDISLHSKHYLTFEAFFPDEQNPAVVITRPNARSAHIHYKPTVQMQQQHSAQGIAGRFIVRYDVRRALDTGDIQVINGYFVHALSPADLPPIPKNVMFVLDVSGSMSGRKINQLKEAMNTILDDIRHEDSFNIIKFESSVHYWRDTMVPATGSNIRAARRFVNEMRASGG